MGGIIKRLQSVVPGGVAWGLSGVGGRGTTQREADMPLATVGCLAVALEPGKEEVCLEPPCHLPSSRELGRVVVGGWAWWPFSLLKGSSRLDSSSRGVTGVSGSCATGHPLESVEIGFRRHVGSYRKCLLGFMKQWDAEGKRGDPPATQGLPGQ